MLVFYNRLYMSCFGTEKNNENNSSIISIFSLFFSLDPLSFLIAINMLFCLYSYICISVTNIREICERLKWFLFYKTMSKFCWSTIQSFILYIWFISTHYFARKHIWKVCKNVFKNFKCTIQLLLYIWQLSLMLSVLFYLLGSFFSIFGYGKYIALKF